MSFASETKNELARMLPEKKCCMLADIAGFMRLAGSIRLVGGGRFEIVMMTSNLAVVRHYKTLIRNYFSVDIGIGVEQGNSLEKSSNYILSIGPEDRSEQILREAGILMVKEGMNFISDGIYDGIIKTKCCRKSYLRGAFLASGTVSNPEKGYHFELHTSTETQARDLRKVLNSFTDISPRIVARKKGFGVYLKAREQIRDVLAIMGASSQFFEFDNVLMMKDLMSKTHRAAEQQIRSIERIQRQKGLAFLSPKLQETAQARLDHPELGIEELGKLMNPPLSKSGVNNRLRKIEEIAKKLPGASVK